jgi:hypothetical protein
MAQPCICDGVSHNTTPQMLAMRLLHYQQDHSALLAGEEDEAAAAGSGGGGGSGRRAGAPRSPPASVFALAAAMIKVLIVLLPALCVSSCFCAVVHEQTCVWSAVGAAFCSHQQAPVHSAVQQLKQQS